MKVVNPSNTASENKNIPAPLLPLVDITKDVKAPVLVLGKELQRQIQFCHIKVGNIEWSGNLLYKFADSKDNISSIYNKDRKKDIIIVADKFLLRDVGTAGGTDFDLSVEEQLELADYIMGNPEKSIEGGYRVGLIHTHHNMDTYFSGVDKKELQDNTANHEVYLSLIVNHKDGGTPIAKLCWVGQRVTEQKVNDNFKFKGKNRKTSRVITRTEDVIFCTDLEIKFDIESDIVEKLTNIKETRRLAAIEKNKAKTTYYPTSKANNNSKVFTRPNYGQYLTELEKVLTQMGIKTTVPKYYHDVTELIAHWIKGKANKTTFWSLANGMAKISQAKLDELEDGLYPNWDKMVATGFPSETLLHEEELLLVYRFLDSINTSIYQDNPAVQVMIKVLDDIGLQILEEIEPYNEKKLTSEETNEVENDDTEIEDITWDDIDIGDKVIVDYESKGHYLEGTVVHKNSKKSNQIKVKFDKGKTTYVKVDLVAEVEKTAETAMQKVAEDLQAIAEDLETCMSCSGTGYNYGLPCKTCSSKKVMVN
jgi:hypothetical protein